MLCLLAANVAHRGLGAPERGRTTRCSGCRFVLVPQTNNELATMSFLRRSFRNGMVLCKTAVSSGGADNAAAISRPPLEPGAHLRDYDVPSLYRAPEASSTVCQ